MVANVVASQRTVVLLRKSLPRLREPHVPVSTREAAEQLVRRVEADVRDRQEHLRAEVRMLEQRKRDALERLREIAAVVQDVLPTRERPDSMVSDLKPERQAAPSDR